MSSHLLLPAAAIDVGFHNTKYTSSKLANAAGPFPCGQFPSLAPRLVSQMDAMVGSSWNGCPVQVGGASFFVGMHSPQMLGAAGIQRAAAKDYSSTPEYLALLRGALWHIARDNKVEGHLKIEHLTVGLPMAHLKTHRADLIKLVQGEHLLPSPTGKGDMKVYVQHVHVLSQPQGALLHYSDEVDGSVEQEDVVVADMGGGTFDWYTCEHSTPNLAKSGSHNKGMLNCAAEVCRIVAPNDVANVTLLGRIDEALRLGQTEVKITGRMVSMTHAIQAAHGVVDEVLRQLANSVGSMAAVDRLLLAGGGAPLLKARIPEVLPEIQHVATMDKEPVFSNVRGFLVFSLTMAQDD